MLLERLLENMSVRIEPFAVCEVERGCRLSLDRDPAVTVHFVLAGAGNLAVGRSIVDVYPRVLVLVPQQQHHELIAFSVQADRSPTVPREQIRHVRSLGQRGSPDVVVACGHLVARFGGGPALFERLREPIALDFSGEPEMTALFDAILRESGSGEPGGQAMLSALMNRCLVMVFRRLCDREDCPLPWLSALEDERMAAVLDTILREPGSDHSIESLADAAHMSRTAFTEQFRTAFGTSPMAFVREQRLRRAAELLADRSTNVGAVAGRVGFSSRAHFSTVFRKRYGSTPGDYRRQALGGGAAKASAEN